ncbi:hypothetical protein Tdes44962_MAKER05334 [Teratosphaeria destructans]|uniref:Uncharacterized protein n=1 Tax=Teratosphaeria destructans TaxID=418781 RepID=A0A9W7VZ80_9PEZI|nr:hypothetical protein Tdes44962_MAKER05334 [Teratosphaeria destructans]
MGRTNFTRCGMIYMNGSNATMLQSLDGWNGSTWIIEPNIRTQISTAGCKRLCGTGADYYDWSQSSATITTWVLPIAGVLLQAPFLSNAFWETVFSIARWCGSPIASLSYILWNIKVSGKCALMADMAAPYDHVDKDPGRTSDYASMRDSMYLLVTMNQYSIDSRVLKLNGKLSDSKPAEGLLRATLFSKDLRLLRRKRVIHELEHAQPVETTAIAELNQQLQAALNRNEVDDRLEPVGELNSMRQKLAQQLRETRKRGVVPVFISTLWFVFAMAISIQSSFDLLGSNAVAHDLALGCLLAWLPVLIMCSIVDRNPVSADDVRKKLNRLVDHVRKSLTDPVVRNMFINTIEDNGERSDMRRRIEDVGDKCSLMQDVPFFEQFAGQGRVRWHYGAAHPILCDIEDAYIAEAGRHWLRNEAQARTFLVLGKRTGGLDWLDYRELWQVAGACFCVCGTVFGAWVLSFFTPTVGLGCRSGGYTVFLGAALGLLLVEMALWWHFDANKSNLREWRRRATGIGPNTARIMRFGLHVRRSIDSATSRCASAVGSTIDAVLPRRWASRLRAIMALLVVGFTDLTPQKRWDYFFFRPLEAANAVYLLYRTISQSVRYLLLAALAHLLITASGTTISVTVMSCSMLYIVLEWCLQSHLSAASVVHAANGLQRVRQTHRLTWPLRRVLYCVDDRIHDFECVFTKWLKELGILSRAYQLRPVGLRWSKEAKPQPQQPSIKTQGADDGPRSVILTDAEGSLTAQMPEYAHIHGRRPSQRSETRLGLLPTDTPWRPTFGRRSSSASSFRRSNSPPSPTADLV